MVSDQPNTAAEPHTKQPVTDDETEDAKPSIEEIERLKHERRKRQRRKHRLGVSS